MSTVNPSTTIVGSVHLYVAATGSTFVVPAGQYFDGNYYVQSKGTATYISVESVGGVQAYAFAPLTDGGSCAVKLDAGTYAVNSSNGSATVVLQGFLLKTQ